MKTKKPAKGKNARAAGKTVKKPSTKATNGRISAQNRALIALLEKWKNEEPCDDEGTLEEFKAALERNRLGERRLFRD